MTNINFSPLFSQSFLIEALAVGVMVVIVGTLVSKIFEKKKKLPSSCADWNKDHVMEKSLLFIGFTVHVICEIFGINRWYCANGFACKK